MATISEKAPELVSQWSNRNTEPIDSFTHGSKKKAWWVCSRGHEWEAVIHSRVGGGRGCPYCSNKKVLPGYNDLRSTHPNLADEWGPGNELKPEQVSSGSHLRVTWMCFRGHTWEAVIANRGQLGSKCPGCDGKFLTPGETDLLSQYPGVAAEWHPTRNGGKNPLGVHCRSVKKAWWLGSCQHEWFASIRGRTARGYGCPFCTGRKVLTGFNDLATVRPDLVAEWSDSNSSSPEDFTFKSKTSVEWVCSKGHKWHTQIYNRTAKNGTECRRCGFVGTSRGEIELVEFLRDLGEQARQHLRSIAPGYEFDAVIENKRLVIEFNGLYWHSSKHKPGADYHLRKTRAANTAGYQLIHVWEDEWLYRRPVVEKMLKRKLGVSDEPRLNARSLTFREVTSAESSKFLEESHIQGTSGGSWRGGLFAGEELVALMVMKRRSEGVYELVRFATSAIVRGGHSKLLKRAIRDLNPQEVVTFSDNCVSGGDLYAQAGFERVKELSPDYMYRVGTRREHKFNYRKARFKKDPNLKYEEGLTERELADLNGLDRVYDAGKVKWVLYV